MFALGVLSLVQMCFLPGFLLLKLLNVRSASWLGVLVLSFALSLVANYFIIFPLTALGVYTRPLLIGLMVAEADLIVLLIVRRRRERETPRSELGDAPEQQGPSLADNPFAVLVLVLASYWFLVVFVRNVGTIFTIWDAVVRWNPWAQSWAAGELPHRTWEYPQLLPTNWSVSYVLMDANLQFFPKAVMPLFALFVLVVFLDLALRTRGMQYVWGFAITCILYRALLPTYVPSGYAEFAVAFFAFAAVYCLINAERLGNTPDGRRYMILGAILAGGCAVTKQAGLFMVVAYPVLVYVLYLRRSAMTRSACVGLLGLCVACIVEILGPWYVYKEIEIIFGQDYSIVEFLVVDLHESRPLFARLAHGIGMIGSHLAGAVGLVAILVTLLLGLFDRKSFWIACIVVVPYTLIWGFCFSYTLRNYSLPLPFLGLVCGTGIAHGWRLLQRLPALSGAKARWRLSRRASWICAAVAGLVVAAGLVLGSVSLTGDRMLRRQEALMRLVAFPKINAMLYRYAERCSVEGEIVTDYDPVEHLPGLKQYRHERDLAHVPEEEYPALLAGTAEEPLTYLLFSSEKYPRLFEAVKKACETGQCELAEKSGSWYLVVVHGGPATSSPAPPDEDAEQSP